MTNVVDNLLRRGVRYRVNRPCGEESIEKGREPTQLGYYRHACSFIKGPHVLDVGCGVGAGLRLLTAVAPKALGIDIDPRLERDDEIRIRTTPLAKLPDKAFDTVVCIDVVEHIDEDRKFVAELFRVARRNVYIAVPNFAVNANTWPYHAREYTPRELRHMLAPFGRLHFFGGDGHGEAGEPIRRLRTYEALCELYSYRGLIWIGRVLRRLLFMRVWHHHIVVVDLKS